jgi:hypothetical protein
VWDTPQAPLKYIKKRILKGNVFTKKEKDAIIKVILYLETKKHNFCVRVYALRRQ